MPPKPEKSKAAKLKAATSGSKGKKKKWTKGKVHEKANNLALFDKGTFDKLLKEVPNYKLITPAVVSDRLKIRVSLARRGINELVKKGLVKLVASGHSQAIYIRATKE